MKQLLHHLHVILDKRIVFRPTHPMLSHPEVERIIQHRLPVSADVKRDRQRQARRHPGTCGIKCRLADGDSHGTHALIAEAEDAFPIGRNDEAHVFFRPVREDLFDPAFGSDRQIHASTTVGV